MVSFVRPGVLELLVVGVLAVGVVAAVLIACRKGGNAD